MNKAIFRKPYSISRNKKHYPKVLPWVENFGKWVGKEIRKDKNESRKVSGFTLDAPTGTTKLMAMLTMSQFIPLQEYSLIVVHRTDLVEQHTQDIDDLQSQQWVETKVKVITYNRIVSLIKKIHNNKKLTKDDKDLRKYLQLTSLVFFDEIHKYSKGEEVKSLPTIISYLKENSLQYFFGVTATSKRATGWYKLITDICNVNEQNAYYERRYVYSKIDAHKDGVIDIPEVVCVNTGLKLDLGFGFSSLNMFELEQKSVEELEKITSKKWKEEIENYDPFELKKDLKKQQKDNTKNFIANTLYDHIRSFVNYRVRAFCYCYGQKKFVSKPALVFVPQQTDANKAKRLFDKTFKDTKVDSIVWHGTSEEFLDNKGKSETIRKRLEDPNDPLKVVFLVGMWQEGTDLQFIEQVHDCSFTPKGVDRAEQVKGRLRNGGHYFFYQDVLNTRKIGEKQLEEMKKEFGSDVDEKFFQSLLEAVRQGTDETDKEDQTGVIKDPEDYVDQGIVNKNLEDLFEDDAPIIVGWVKKVKKGDTQVVTVPRSTFINKDEKVNLSKRMKIENFFEGF